LRVRSTSRYAADYDVKAQTSFGSQIEYVVKPEEERVLIYARSIVLSRHGSESKTVWLSFPVRREPPRPYQDGEHEWSYPIEPIHLEGGWLKFELNLGDAVNQTFGLRGWRFGQLLGFRIRGNLSLAFISIYAQR
jgi:hypothetical protein